MKRLSIWLSKTNIRNFIAITTVVGSFVFLYRLANSPVPEGNRDLINILGGMVIGTSIAAVFGYYFGSNKDETDRKKSNNPNKDIE